MTPSPLMERFIAKVDVSVDGCWQWTAGKQRGDYGAFSMKRADGLYRMRPAHRVSYELFVGDIPEGLELDHLCRNHGCVRPDHLEPVTRRENMLRGRTFAARQAAITECPKGHPYDEANTQRYGNKRQCRTCVNERQRQRWHADTAFREQQNRKRRERWAAGR